MSKPFKAIVPSPYEPAYQAYKFAPAVVVGDQVHVSGLIGYDETGAVPDDLAEQIRNILGHLELILGEAGASLPGVFSLTSYHVGDVAAQMPEFIAQQSSVLGAPHPAWTAIGVSSLALPGAKLEVSAIARLP